MEHGFQHDGGYLSVDAHHPSGTIIVRLTGEHDVSTADELDRALSVLVAQRHPVILDTSGATFLDSTVLGSLLSHTHKAEANGIPWRVVTPEPRTAQRIFQVAGSLRFLPTAPTLDAALAEIAESS